MAVKYTRPRGTEDVLPAESWKWHYLENAMRETARRFGYREMRMPTFEATELFARGVGEGTDIVSKEMYTFEDKGGRSISLRPEGTAGVVRATLENGLLASSPLPLKSYYLQSCFRYERAQKGRLREFHQFGVECFGTSSPAADTEVMAVAQGLFCQLGVERFISLEINSIGCPACRPAYHAALKAYFEGHLDALCPTCHERLEKNPLRVLDCKEARCQAIAKDAPLGLDYLCGDCQNHFEETKARLDELGLAYTVNPRIVRGLDYYTNTVFEFIAAGVGTQGTVCGGGRYDILIEQMGGAATPAVGFGMGVERMLMLLAENGALPQPPAGPDVFLVGAGEAGASAARRLTGALRQAGFAAECDLAERSVKAQMKAAGRLGARFTAVLGEDEVAAGAAKLKDMFGGGECAFPLEDAAAALAGALAAPPAGPREGEETKHG